MEKIKIGVVGYGNIGRGVINAIKMNPDMQLNAVLTRRPEVVKKEVKDVPVLPTDVYPLPEGITIDVAILCGGSKQDLPTQGPQFAGRFNTIDSFDTHADIPKYFEAVDRSAKEGKHISIISLGWDPGIFSLERVLADAFLPGSKRYTFWGPGVSQGHSDAVRKIKGVVDARQYTLPITEALDKVRGGETPEFTKRQMHKRLVYVVAEPGVDLEKIRQEIVNMPNYFDEYNTEVKFISKDEMEKNHSKYPHGGFVFASGVTGDGNKEILEYRCQLESNPSFTGSVLVAYARAAYRLNAEGKSGAFTILDVPASYISPRTTEELKKNFM